MSSVSGYPDEPSDVERAVWETLHDRHGSRPMTVYALAVHLNLGRRAVQQALRELRRAGHARPTMVPTKRGRRVRAWMLTSAGRSAVTQLLRLYAAEHAPAPSTCHMEGASTAKERPESGTHADTRSA